MESCSVWNSLTQREKESKVKCIKHPFKSDHTTSNCTVSGRKCKCCNDDTHHFLLCPKKKVKSSSNVAKNATASCAIDRSNKLPVLLQAQFISTPHCSKVGTFLDLGSTDNYVTHKYAQKHKLHGESVELEVEGIGGKKSYVQSKVYSVPIIIKGKIQELECYGLDVISSVTPPPKKESYAAMCKKFGVSPDEVKRPSKIDILISMWDNSIHPSKIKTIGKMIFI